jgi:mutator protein MutT
VIIEVVAAIIRRDSQILITRRFKDVHLPGLWEFPGGKVEPNESLQAALEREILEELGVNIRIEEELFTVEYDYPAKSIRLHFFTCSIIDGDPSPIDVADLCWVSAAELVQFEFPPADAELIAKLRHSH